MHTAYLDDSDPITYYQQALTQFAAAAAALTDSDTYTAVVAPHLSELAQVAHIDPPRPKLFVVPAPAVHPLDA